MIRYYQIATLGFFLTTIIYFSANRNKSILVTSKDVKIVMLLDSIETLNKDNLHLREYFDVAIQLNDIAENCRKCNKLKQKQNIYLID